MPKKTSDKTGLMIKILAWAAIVIGAFGIIGVFTTLIMHLSGFQDTLAQNMEKTNPGSGDAYAQMMQMTQVMSYIQLPFSALYIWAGIAVLRHQDRARAWLEGAVWIHIVLTWLNYILVGAHSADFMKASMAGHVPPASANAAAAAAVTATANVVGNVVAGFMIVIPIISTLLSLAIVYYLRREKSREWFEKGAV